MSKVNFSNRRQSLRGPAQRHRREGIFRALKQTSYKQTDRECSVISAFEWVAAVAASAPLAGNLGPADGAVASCTWPCALPDRPKRAVVGHWPDLTPAFLTT